MIYNSVFISDIHLGTKKCKAKKLLKFLGEVQCNNLYLVGDILDIWALKRKTYWTDLHTEIIRKILKLSEKINVYYVVGNHDEFIRPFYKFSNSLGPIRIADDFEYLALDGRRILVTHGDKHDFWMKVPRQVINFLAHFTDWAEEAKKENTSIQRYKRTCTTESDIIKFCKKHNYDSVICGHTHAPKLLGNYMNTGDWCHNCTFIAEKNDGTWQLNIYK